MIMEKSDAKFDILLNTKNVIALTIVSWIIFIILSLVCGQNFLNGLNLFKGADGYSLAQYLQDLSLYTCGTFIVFILPGLIWACRFMKQNISFSELLFYSFLTSLTVFILITTIYKIFIPSGLNGSNFSSMVILITLSGLLGLISIKGHSSHTVTLTRNHLMVCLVLTVLTIICCWIFQNKILWVDFDNNFSAEHVLTLPLGAQDDLMEHFGLVDSLKQHFLPFWDLEYADKFGYSVIDPPLHAFVSLFLFLFFGQSFAVQSLNTVMVMLVSYCLILKMSESGLGKPPCNFVSYLIPVLFLSYFLVILFHHASAVVLCDHIHFMCFFTMAQFYFLSNKKHGLFLVFALLAFLTKYEAMMFTLFGLLFYQRIYKATKMEIASLLKKYLCLILPFILLAITIGWFQRDLGTYMESISVERFMRLDYFGLLDRVYPQSRFLWETFSISTTLEFIKQFILATGFLGVFIFFPQKDRASLLLRGVALFYFFLVIISRIKRLHYISPLVVLSTIVALRLLLQVRLDQIKGGGR